MEKHLIVDPHVDVVDANVWENYILPGGVIDNGVYAVTMADSQLDEENWPVSAVVLRAGVIIKQHVMYNSNACVYTIPNMVGWDTTDLAAWVNSCQAEDVQENCIMIVEDREVEI